MDFVYIFIPPLCLLLRGSMPLIFKIIFGRYVLIFDFLIFLVVFGVFLFLILLLSFFAINEYIQYFVWCSLSLCLQVCFGFEVIMIFLYKAISKQSPYSFDGHLGSNTFLKKQKLFYCSPSLPFLLPSPHLCICCYIYKHV